jgi:signal transduction histidine kinase
MKPAHTAFTRLYGSGLRAHLASGTGPDAGLIGKIADRVRIDQVGILELADVHEGLLCKEMKSGITVAREAAMIRRGGGFFTAVVAAVDAGQPAAGRCARLGKALGALGRRCVELAAVNRRLSAEIVRRGEVEAALRHDEAECREALRNSEMLKDQLRDLSRQVLAVHEEERKMLSRELHDVIAQALLGINVRLATLKREAGINTGGLKRNISLTQKLVAKSADIVHRFARELRPAVVDDLGLVPALHSFLKSFMTRTGIRTHLTVSKGVEAIDAARSMVLYRVAQEALTNVARHAHASRADVIIRKEGKFIRMEIKDDGRSFRVEPVLLAGGTRRLGLLGMRERVEMVGGFFEIESLPGKGTTIIAHVPAGGALPTDKESLRRND